MRITISWDIVYTMKLFKFRLKQTTFINTKYPQGQFIPIKGSKTGNAFLKTFGVGAIRQLL